MKANELMIGDWVYCEGHPTPDNVTIQTIAADGVWFEGKEYEGAASYDRIFPIPITPEILEKNGFSQDPLNGHIFIFYEKSGEVIYYEYGPKYGLTIDNQLATIQDLKIKNVHELQHVLRLCGIKKEIEI